MSSRIKLTLLAASILLVGAGCSPAATPSNTEEVEETTENPTTTDENTANEDEEAVSVSTDAELDDTWMTYENKALGFTFRWPSKGINAPRWEVVFAPEKDAVDGCIGEGDKRTVMVGDVSFCHTTTTSGDVRTDRYATKHGSQYTVITFTKSAPGADYAAHLDQIVSTYQSGK